MKPVIAIPKLGPGLERLGYRLQYESALRSLGAQVRWIGTENIGSVTDCDGLLIPGGDDVDPKLYGQKKSALCGDQNPLRDQLDPALLKAFLPTKKPILGICRGMQMLNVHLSGTLHQDIKALQKMNHQQTKEKYSLKHNVTIREGTLLHSILGCQTLAVNTLHHQAVDHLGQGLTLAACSQDGIAEAIELEGHPFCLAVQWHPEMLVRQHPAHRAILAAFVEACRG